MQHAFLFRRNGTQIIHSPLPLAGSFQTDVDIFKQNVLDVILLVAGEEHTVLTLAGDVEEANILDAAAVGVGVPVVGRHHDRLRAAPPALGKAAGLDHDVGEAHVPHTAAVANLDGQTPVASGNDAVIHQNILEICHALCADLDRGTGRGQRAVGDDDVLGGAVLVVACCGLEADAVICTLDMAANDPHIGGVIRIDTVGVGAVQRVQHPDVGDQHIVASGRVQRPERRVLQCHVMERDVVAVLHIHHGGTGVKITVEVVTACPLHKGINIAVHCALTRDGEVVCILGVNKGVSRFCHRTIHGFCAGNCCHRSIIAVGVEIGGDIGVRFQKGALFQMQLHVAFQLDRTGIVGMTALQYNAAAACCVAGINGRLDCSGIIGCAIADSAILGD